MNSFVHGRLPYDLIKPDSQLRNLLRSITQRKIVSLNKKTQNRATNLTTFRE